MNAIAQTTLIDTGPATPPTDRVTVAPRARHSERRRASGGRQMRLRLVPRPADAVVAPLDPRALAHAAARLATAPDGALVDMHLRGQLVVVPAPAARGADAPDALLVVAPCAAGGSDLDTFDGRAVVVGRGARSGRLAGRARIDGPWLWLAPLDDDGPGVRLPMADTRVWGEIMAVLRTSRRGDAMDEAGARAS